LISTNLYRIWIYSGDTDAAVPITGTKDWIAKLKLESNLNDIFPWTAWFDKTGT